MSTQTAKTRFASPGGNSGGPSFPGSTIQVAGVTVATGIAVINFASGATAAPGAPGTVNINIAGGGGSTILAEYNNVPIAGGPFTTLNFFGAGVSVVNLGGGVLGINIAGTPAAANQRFVFVLHHLTAPEIAAKSFTLAVAPGPSSGMAGYCEGGANNGVGLLLGQQIFYTGNTVTYTGLAAFAPGNIIGLIYSAVVGGGSQTFQADIRILTAPEAAAKSLILKSIPGPSSNVVGLVGTGIEAGIILSDPDNVVVTGDVVSWPTLGGLAAGDAIVFLYYTSVGGSPGQAFQSDLRTLNGPNIAAKTVTLAATPGSGSDVIGVCVGGVNDSTQFIEGVDFTIAGNIVNFAMSALVFAPGDQIAFGYSISL